MYVVWVYHITSITPPIYFLSKTIDKLISFFRVTWILLNLEISDLLCISIWWIHRFCNLQIKDTTPPIRLKKKTGFVLWNIHTFDHYYHVLKIPYKRNYSINKFWYTAAQSNLQLIAPLQRSTRKIGIGVPTRIYDA